MREGGRGFIYFVPIIYTLLYSVLMTLYLLYALLSVAIRNKPAIASSPP